MINRIDKTNPITVEIIRAKDIITKIEITKIVKIKITIKVQTILTTKNFSKRYITSTKTKTITKTTNIRI